MIRGRVRPSRADGSGLEAWVEIAIAGDDGVLRTLTAIVDTGFTGWLTVPSSVMLEPGLIPSGNVQSTMANGLEAESVFCAAIVEWHGNAMDVLVDIMDNNPLIGTDLLADSRLIIDWWDGGDVVIEERMPPA